MNPVLKRFLISVGVVLVIAPTIPAYQIKLIDSDWSFGVKSETGWQTYNHTTFGDVPSDDGLAIRLWFESQWLQFFYTEFGGLGGVQQEGRALFTLQWIPVNKNDIPRNPPYTAKFTIHTTMAVECSVGNLWYPPGNGSAEVTLQSWLLSKECDYSSPAPCDDPPSWNGCPFTEFQADPIEHRELAVQDWAVNVTFERIDGNWIGVVEVPTYYQVAVGFLATGSEVFTGSGIEHAGLIARAKITECAGVTVSQ